MWSNEHQTESVQTADIEKKTLLTAKRKVTVKQKTIAFHKMSTSQGAY